MIKTATFSLSYRQNEAFNMLEDPDVDELLYGGAKGGGKSVFGCYWVLTKAKEVIDTFGLRVSTNPPCIGYMGRKQSVDFNNTTLNSWKRFIPQELYEIHRQEKLIIVGNTVAIQYGGMDRIETLNKFNSAEYAFYFVDQAEECSESDIGALRGALRLKMKGRNIAYKGLMTANPAVCWLKDAFIDHPQPRTRFVKALPVDNPFLPPNYVETLKKAFSHKPELLAAYLYGKWEDLDLADVVIPLKHVQWNVCNNQFNAIEKRITVCDISEEGGEDESVIYNMLNTRIETQEIYAHRTLMDTAGRLQAHARQNKSNMIAVDIVGSGKGVYDRLREVYEGDSKMRIYGYDGRRKALDPITFGNSRAEDHWHAASMFSERRCDIPNDPELIRQLAGITYKFKSDGRIYIDLKEKIKERLRCSPDRSDTYIMGLKALKEATPVKKPDAYMREAEYSENERELDPDLV